MLFRGIMDIKKASYDYSLKCIPIPNHDAHTRGVINKAEQFLQRLRWKVHFFFNPSDKPPKETFGFNTRRNAPQNNTLTNFEHDMTHLISNLEYTDKKTPFQKKIINDAKNIRNSNQIFVTADKTSNVYQLDKNTYDKLLTNNVTSHYEKTTTNTENKINTEAKQITDTLKISDRVEPIAHKNAYITLKDHKENFPNNVKCRLINPTKTNIGKISKTILQNINEQIRTKLKLQQWRSTTDALNWFKKLEDKKRLKFIQLDIVDFYPSITETLFNAAINFASQTTDISPTDKATLHNARQSILIHNDHTWKKTTGLFDVTMGSYDGCELCELVGLYTIHKMQQNFPDINFGLYRDDGLGTLKHTPKTKLERTKKAIFKMFKDELGLAITLETDLTVVNFLDVTLDLHSDKYHPFRKPNDNPTYIHKHSNHPPHVAKQLPIAVNKRLNEISCDKESFNNSKTDYEKALKDSNLDHKLTYNANNEPKSKKNQRKRNVIWFNPPYSTALNTNLGREFLKLIDKHFPVNNPLSKIINRRTVKLSYSCTENLQTIMQNHNRKTLAKTTTNENKRCNCRNKATCPIPGNCCAEKIVYQATVKHDDGKTAVYIGSTETNFKARYNNHKKSFNHEKYKSETTLSKHLWDNRINKTHNITWKILKQCNTYDIGQKNCDLCLSEKFYIIKNFKSPNLINKRTDIGNKCVHLKKQTFQSAIT